MAASHTPGPWAARTGRSSWGGPLPPLVVGPRGQRLATVDCPETVYLADGSDVDPDAAAARDDANARLMAAALDLLAACEQLTHSFNDETEAAAWDAIRAAVAKATGETAP